MYKFSAFGVALFLNPIYTSIKETSDKQLFPIHQFKNFTIIIHILHFCLKINKSKSHLLLHLLKSLRSYIRLLLLILLSFSFSFFYTSFFSCNLFVYLYLMNQALLLTLNSNIILLALFFRLIHYFIFFLIHLFFFLF